MTQAGLHVVFDSAFSDPPRVAELDIVAVHGLNFKNSDDHARKTWTMGDKLWLKDFLPDALSKPARVMLFEYNSSPAIGATAIKLAGHANNLLQWLKLKRKGDAQKPLVFICHSLGGLVVKEALVAATLDVTYKSIVEATCLLVFFATPHQGGNYASLGDIVAKIVRTGMSKPRNDLLDALKENSDQAMQRFEQARHLPERCLVVSFYEGVSYGKIGLVRQPDKPSEPNKSHLANFCLHPYRSSQFHGKRKPLSVFKPVIGRTERPEWGELESLFQSKRRPLWGWEVPAAVLKL